MVYKRAFSSELRGIAMAKTERITVWIVTLPNGKKVEIDPAVAERYFGNGRETTPFSHLHVEPVVRTVRVKPTPKPAAPAKVKAKPAAKKKHATRKSAASKTRKASPARKRAVPKAKKKTTAKKKTAKKKTAKKATKKKKK